MKTIGRVILSAIFAVLTGLLVAAAKVAPDELFVLYRQFSQWILDKLAAITGVVSFAVWEVLAVVLILWGIYSLIQSLRKMRFLRWLSGVLVTATALVFVFVAVWGLGHFGPPITDEMGLEVGEYTVEQLYDATLYYTQKANELSGAVARNQDGAVDFSQFDVLASRALDGFRVLEYTYPSLGQGNASVKELLLAPAYSYGGITGIFVAFTGESSVNPQTYELSLPFTMCHELAHRLGVTAEDDANFIGFLAASTNPDPEFQYSAYYSAFVYTYNALHKVDTAKASEIWDMLSDNLKADCYGATEHYKPYEGKVQEATQKVNDTYLKAFDQEEGVQSYGAVADQLIAWYENF